MEIKRTIPKGAVGSKDFKTKKIFVGGIPSSVNEGDFFSCSFFFFGGGGGCSYFFILGLDHNVSLWILVCRGTNLFLWN